MTETSNRYDRRRERTRRVLVDAGRQLIAARGVAGLRIQDITVGADVGMGSFYNHFSSKEELVEVVVAESLTRLAETAGLNEDNQDTDPALTAARAVVRVVRLATEDPAFAHLVVHLNNADSVFGHAMHPRAREVVVLGVERGRFDVPDVDAAVNFVVAASFALIRRILDGEHDDHVVLAHTTIALRALGVRSRDAARIAERAVTG